MRTRILTAVAALLIASGGAALAQAPQGDAVRATPGKALDMVFVPKFLGSPFAGPDHISMLFDQAHAGADQAAQELKNPTALRFTGPTRVGQTVVPQIESVTAAIADGVKAIMISNNSGDAIVPALKTARAKGVTVVSWDFAIPAPDAEDLTVTQVDFTTSGKVLAEMAYDTLGAAGGKLAILTTAPDGPGPAAWAKAFQAVLRQDPKYATFEVVDAAYGQGDDAISYKLAQTLVAKHADLKLIVAPDSFSLLASAKAMRDDQRCGATKVVGFGIPSDMRPFVQDCVPGFALWSFADLGYLAYYTAYLLATDVIKAQPGQTFAAGRLGTYTIAADPNRPQGLRIVLGPWKVFDKTVLAAVAE